MNKNNAYPLIVVDRRSKLNDESLKYAINLRYPLRGHALSWKIICQKIMQKYGVSISEQGLLQLYNRYKDKLIITNVSKQLSDQIENVRKTYYFELEGAPDIKFTGIQLLEMQNKHELLRVYATTNANMVLYKKSGDVVQSKQALLLSEVTDFFGWSSLAKDLYDEMGIKRYIEVE